MLTSPGGTVTDDRPAYRPYRAAVSSIRRLSPHFVRVTFACDEFCDFGTAGLDQRIKLLLPLPGRGVSDVGDHGGEWYARWRELPEDERNPFRTYTVRAARPEQCEVDVDFAFHGDGGPAARWVRDAAVGDELVLVGPDERSASSHVGIDWHPGSATHLLLAGDETAAPAICSVLESLPAGSSASAFIEVPETGDTLSPALPHGCSITWLGRDGAPHGSLLDPAVRAWVATHRELILPTVLSRPQPLADIDVDVELLWDAPEEKAGSDFYAWLAGEAATIKSLRRFLVSETGIDRSRVAFMGYWRLGKAEGQ
jgi:NADPH-dependent ferric siderophore reductase